jgi:nicotinate-nucleotide adenylyltransferase
MKVGVLGGTFDPPHIGHLVIGDQALHQLRLDEIWYTPVGQPTHKVGRPVSPAMHRVAMTRLAIATHAQFRLREDDVERPGPHYSLTLMQLLRERHPEHAFTFIIGEDSLADLPKWHQPARLLDLVALAVAHRPGIRPNMAAIHAVVPDIERRVRWVEAPLLDLTSTDLRQRLGGGRSTRYLMPRAVADYAAEHALYTSAGH